MVRSITKDPFQAVGFLAQEMGAITPQNQLLNESKRALVKSYIDHYVKHYDVIGTAAMRSTHVEIDNEKLYGLTFVTGVVPRYDSLLPGNYCYRYEKSPAIIYIPSQAYKYGEFVILEDAFAYLFSNFHTLFDEDLKIEKPKSLILGESGEIDIEDDEDRIMVQQYYIMRSLTTLFEYLLNVTQYGILNGKVDHTLWTFLPIRGVPLLNFPDNSRAFFQSEPCYFGIDFPWFIMLASARRLLKLIHPGVDAGGDTFDKKITRRFFAQCFYLNTNLNDYYTRMRLGLTIANVEDIMREGVDRQLEAIRLIESPAFMESPLEAKYLLFDDLYKGMLKRLKTRKEKDNGNSENKTTETGNTNIDGIETATED